MRSTPWLLIISIFLVACTQPAAKKPAAKAGDKNKTGKASDKDTRKAIASRVQKAIAKMRKDRATSKAPQPAPKPMPRPDLPPPIKGPIPALKLKPLSAELPAKAIVKALRKAHYDAERLGLRKLDFDLDYLDKKRKITIKAKGSWKSGAPATVAINSFVSDDKTIGQDSKPHKQMREAMTFRLRRLLEGLANGYLTQRLFAWSRQEGKVTPSKSAKGRLELTYAVKNEFNAETVTVVVDPKLHRVDKVTRSSNRGVIREMSYSYKMIDGRNLVTNAVASVRFTANAKLKRKMQARLMTLHGMTFQFTHKKVDRFYLPTQLYRKSPKLGQDISLEWKYSAAR